MVLVFSPPSLQNPRLKASNPLREQSRAGFKTRGGRSRRSACGRGARGPTRTRVELTAKMSRSFAHLLHSPLLLGAVTLLITVRLVSAFCSRVPRGGLGARFASSLRSRRCIAVPGLGLAVGAGVLEAPRLLLAGACARGAD